MDNNRFSPEERRQLLNLVRQVITSHLCNGELPEIPAIPHLSEPGACFVTLKDFSGNLRGCIGNIEAFEPLGENLIRNAVNAATEDPRFPAVDWEEFSECTLELSILTPAKPIATPEEFVVGRDGIILRAANRGAVFLPQVSAVTQNRSGLAAMTSKVCVPIDPVLPRIVIFFFLMLSCPQF